MAEENYMKEGISLYTKGNYPAALTYFLSLPDDLREYCMTMLKIFDDVHEGTPNVTFEVVS